MDPVSPKRAPAGARRHARLKQGLLIFTLLALVAAHLALVLPVFDHPIEFQPRDSRDYLDLARTFLETGRYQGSEYPGVDLVRPPGYPSFIVIVLGLSGNDPRWISLFQVVVSFMTALLLYRIGTGLGSPKAGMLAVLVYLINPNATFWSLVWLSETLAAFWIVLAVWGLVMFWTKERRRWLLLSGAAFGMSALTRPIFLPVGVGAGLLLTVLWRIGRKPWIEGLKLAAVFILGLGVVILPWQTRNLAVHGRFTLSVVDESTFQNWMVAKILASVEGITRDQAVEQIASSPQPMRYSLEVIRLHPAVFIKEQARGIVRTLAGAEYAYWAQALAEQRFNTQGMLSSLLDQRSLSAFLQILSAQGGNVWFLAAVFALVFDLVLYSLCAAGLWRALRYFRCGPVFNLAVVLALVSFYLLFIPGVAGESRFRVPADPLLASLAGLALFARLNPKTE
ncbi:MAG: hypothetical protein EHM70_03830 [Chloroflexota bacterium]|nr:MAG: hypothetical protein EHM70_03830 [Chloroflexota bacterium]